MSKRYMANVCTASNIMCGTLSLVLTVHAQYMWAATAILAALVFDAMDGRVARHFGVANDFGRELDSLCDVVSFGVAPGLLLYSWQLHAAPWGLGVLAALMYAVCGAMRLARFNLSTDVIHGFFMGLPIPTAGCLAATYVLSGVRLPELLVAPVAMLIAWMMVSGVHYPNFKEKSPDPIQMKAVAATLIIGACLLWWDGDLWPFVPFLMYFIFGILNTCWNRLAR